MKKILILVAASTFLLAGCSSTPTSYEASATYSTEAVEKGTPTGYTKELGNGDFVVGEDIEAGMYNISGLGWADLITSDSMDNLILTQNADGTIQNVTLTEGEAISILDQDNDSMGMDANTVEVGAPITFTQIAPETIEAQDINETLTYDIASDSYTCTSSLSDAEISDCSTLHEYDKLVADIEQQKADNAE